MAAAAMWLGILVVIFVSSLTILTRISIHAILFQNNVCIKELDLSGNDLSDKGAVYLAEALHENYTIDDLVGPLCLEGEPFLKYFRFILSELL
ncbi:hypothetical protein DPMN_100486 [Dreissena polymorpha]|uniref:Uncharacterized protein n=1 Tax=Dreissena polymorpha TaxID=45954 RepID=A0A9D4LH53_DREPO|nr:hypothetical protein DPMN_100486 [Dreissena polymorpha]